MSALFWVSHFILWVLFLVQSLAILALLRQVGLLHLRMGPQGARILSVGPEIGKPAPAVLLQDMDNPLNTIQVSDGMDREMLLLFIVPGCPSCAALTSAIRALIRESNSVVVWAVVAAGDLEACRTFRSEHNLDCLLFAYAPEIRDRYKVYSAPYALLIDKHGIVRSKGIVNHLEHLESLLEMRDPEHEAPPGTFSVTDGAGRPRSVDNPHPLRSVNK